MFLRRLCLLPEENFPRLCRNKDVRFEHSCRVGAVSMSVAISFMR